jgi:hypothetical protein
MMSDEKSPMVHTLRANDSPRFELDALRASITTCKVESPEVASNSVDRETLAVSRHLLDDVPLRITTRLDIRASGKAREPRLANPLLEGTQLLPSMRNWEACITRLATTRTA